MMDRIEADFSKRARAVLQAEGVTVIPLQISLAQAAFILASRGDEAAALHLAVVAGSRRPAAN
jgi:hypothetical protein